MKMNKTNMMSEDYFRLFVKREGKVVLGKNYSNLWLLVSVLTLTFLAVSFSNASLSYLSFKMNDPFINWVDIKNDYGEGDISGLMRGLADSTAIEEYHFVDYQMDYSTNQNFFGKSEDMVQYLSLRFFQSFNGNPLLESILDDDNVVNGASVNFSDIRDDMVGVIITQDAVNRLGYDDAPAFIDMCANSAGADTLGFSLFQNRFARFPIPVLAVVKRLPGNMDIISTKFFYSQRENDNTYPFNLNNREYAVSAHYFVPENVDEESFSMYLREIYGGECDVMPSFIPAITTFAKGEIIGLKGKYNADIDPWEVKKVDDSVKEKFGDLGVRRVFDCDYSDYALPQGSYISVRFKDLNRIRDFESYVKDNFKVKIEMSQINAKENFNAVTVMANILSWAIVVFSIICIMLFIVNLFQSYFQKVKRNLGTFKAFGISNKQLISVYLLIMLVTIVISVLSSLAISYIVESLLPLFGVLKDGAFSYLMLANTKTWWSILIILVSSMVTVYIVMKKLLSATPGNLIYDR